MRVLRWPRQPATIIGSVGEAEWTGKKLTIEQCLTASRKYLPKDSRTDTVDSQFPPEK